LLGTDQLEIVMDIEALSEKGGTLAVMVDPIEKNTGRFYERYNIIKLPDSDINVYPDQIIRASW